MKIILILKQINELLNFCSFILFTVLMFARTRIKEMFVNWREIYLKSFHMFLFLSFLSFFGIIARSDRALGKILQLQHHEESFLSLGSKKMT